MIADPTRLFARHMIATLAYRGGKVLRDAPTGFGDFTAPCVLNTPRVLLAHVRAILRRAGMRPGSLTPSCETISFGTLEIDVASRSARLAGRPVDLTSSEFDLLWLLARHAGKVLSRNDILNRLRSLDYDGSDRSVDCRIYRLRRKLGDLADSAERIKTIRNVGYLFSPAHW